MNDWRVRTFGIGAVLWLMFGWASGWREHQCETARSQNHARNPPEIVLPCGCNERGADQTNGAQGPAPQCDWPEMKPDWALVIVGTLTFVAVFWQARATAASAKATRDSVKTTERHFALLNAQWLDVDDFFCEPALGGENDSGIWFVGLRITNNTPLIVRITSIECYIDGAYTTYWTRRTIGPHTDWEWEIPIVPVSPEAKRTFHEGTQLGVFLIGQVNYINALDEKVVRVFARRGVLSEPKRTQLTQELPGDPADLLAPLVARLKADREREKKGQSEDQP